jgi:hypothetical protein
MRRIPGILLVVAAAVLLLAAEARAQSEACVALEARLASLDRGSEDYWNNDLSNTEAAIDRKRAELDRAITSARRAGCQGGFLFKARKPAGNCGALNASVDRIDAGLQRLEAQRRTFAGDPYAADRERSQIIRQMVDNRCGGRQAVHDNDSRRRTGLFSSLFGDRRFLRDRFRRDNGFGGGAYRTLCVRSCDGYYFPISFEATPAAFGRDENACRALCPGTDVALYVHHNPGEEAQHMVSLAGEPYTALPNAFRYRTEYDRSCTCPPVVARGASGPAATVGTPGDPLVPGNPDAILTIAQPTSTAVARIVAPRPRVRTDGVADPETAANRAGRFLPGAEPPRAVTKTTTIIGPDGRSVRVVGPVDFYSIH